MRQGFRAELLASTSAIALAVWDVHSIQHGRRVLDLSTRRFLPWWWIGQPWAPR